MATIRQIEANRLNAQKSTGPRSTAGKARSAMNALKSGIDAQAEIIPGEEVHALMSLAAEYFHRFHPASPQERLYMDILVRADWQLRRLAKAEAQIWNYQIESTEGWKDECPLGKAFTLADSTFARLQRRIDATQRSYQRALAELERLQAGRRDPDPPPQPVANEIASPEIGFNYSHFV
jgi:hypothetical protein